MKHLRSVLARAALLALALATAAQAHFVWLERDSATGDVAAFFGEWIQDLRETEDGYLKIITAPKAFASDGTEIAVTRAHNRLPVAANEAPGDLRLTAFYWSEKSKTLSHYQAKLGRSETAAKHALELVPAAADSNTFTLRLRGAPVPDADVVLFTAAGWSRTFKTDADGKVTIETPWPGQAVIEVAHVEKTPGEHDGHPYDTLRHVSTLTFTAK